MPLRLVFVFVSESSKAGVLRELIGNHFDMLDATKLLGATKNSEVGRYWSRRRRLLLITVLRLQARATFVTPALSVSILYRYGPNGVRKVQQAKSIKSTPKVISDSFEKSYFGKVLTGVPTAMPDGRGRSSSETALEAFRAIAKEEKFTFGKDKELNCAFGKFLKQNQHSGEVVGIEKQLEGFKIIPDISLKFENHLTCLEFHWRAKDLLSTDKSAVAQYIKEASNICGRYAVGCKLS